MATLLIAALLAGGGALYIRRDYAAAERLLARGDIKAAQKRLRRYLRVYRSDDRARLLLAHAIVSDDDRPVEVVAREALVPLDQIDDSSPQGAEARTRAGRLKFLLLLRPGEAERLFRRAIELSPDDLDAHLMLWNLLNVTGRFHLSQPIFWRTYELSSQANKPLLLRDWYLSEFGRGTAFAELDRKLGVLSEKEKPSLVSEFERLRQIRAEEPDWPVGQAALARLLMHEGNKELARDVMKQTQATHLAEQDPFFLATEIELAMDNGEFDRAGELLERWPEPRDGYEYWLWRGTYAEEALHDEQAAIAAYDKALSSPLGDTDWQLMVREAHCLLLAGHAEQARLKREAAAKLEKLMEREIHQRLRHVLSDLQNPEFIREIIAFYRDLGRPREISEWTAHLDRITGVDRETPVPDQDEGGNMQGK